MNLRKLLVDGAPLLDVRAPVEFARGAFPTASNIPLLEDEERHQVGITYKEEGQDAAIELGHRLVNGEVKRARLDAWEAFFEAHPDGALYCFRGGLRSRIVRQWLEERGREVPLVPGGYKALRGEIYGFLEGEVAEIPLAVLSGRTGCGKTDLLNVLPHSVDLEACANHRGSSFGRHPTPQPTQTNFENRLGIDLMRHHAGHPGVTLKVEDESRTIGRCPVPKVLFEKMRGAPVVVLTSTFEERVGLIYRDYIKGPEEIYVAQLGPEGRAVFEAAFLDAIDRIKKRLGDLHWRQIRELFVRGAANDDIECFREMIGVLLGKYYDPMYDYQLDKKSDRVVFTGDAGAVTDYFAAQV